MINGLTRFLSGCVDVILGVMRVAAVVVVHGRDPAGVDFMKPFRPKFTDKT
jgi:hypothetical protein